MTPAQQQAFLMASGIHASSLNFLLRLTAGLLITVVGIFIIIGLIKLLEDEQIQERMRFLLYLLSLATLLMIFFTFVVA
jgi:membrane-associated HD superfamily phosphohydrolase